MGREMLNSAGAVGHVWQSKLWWPVRICAWPYIGGELVVLSSLKILPPIAAGSAGDLQ